MHRFLFLSSLFCTFIYLCISRMPSGYDDFYARHRICPMVGYANENITNNTEILQTCFNNASVATHINTVCAMFKNDSTITCAATALVIHDEEAIVLSFRWTVGQDESYEEFSDYNVTTTFPGGGTVSLFYYTAFLATWNAGIRDAFFSLKNANPSYEVWVTGGSMGASMSAIGAAYISQMGYMPANNIKMINVGELRIGHADFAARYPTLVPYAYRIVHRYDMAPHSIPLTAGYVHHANEIWYNNTMDEGDPYIECDTGESQSCSDSVPPNLWTWADHTTYFSNTCYCKKSN